MSFMYVCEYNCYIHIEEGRLVLENKNDLKTYIPLEQLDGLVLFGNASVSTGTFAQLLNLGIPTTFLSNSGKFFGRLESTRHVNINRQRNQFKLGEDDRFKLNFSKLVLASKIHNQIVLLRRYNRNRGETKVENIISKMNNLRNNLDGAKSIESAIGYEGAAARLYFEALSLLVNPYFKFEGRSKMPPRDPFNSVLSLGYTLLLYEVYTAISNKGLHPYAGFIHKDRQGHPTLASDLMEEWRPIIVDSLTLNIFNRNMLGIKDFIEDKEKGGVFLTKNALKIFIKEFEKKIRTEISYIEKYSSRMSFRRAIQSQVADLCEAIDSGNISKYKPVKLR